MAQDQSSSHQTAHQQQQPHFRPDRCADDYAAIRDIDDGPSSDAALADVRRDDPPPLLCRDDTDNAIGAASPASPTEYQTAMPSPTAPSFPAISSTPQTSFACPGSKRSITYLEADEALCTTDRKRRRREAPSAPSISSRMSKSSSRGPPRVSRCRSLSLPDPSALSRMIQGECESKSNRQSESRIPSALLLLPSLSGDSGPASPSARRRPRDRPIPPPITKSSLRELETQEVLKNAQLIHDIIHDPSLQFRPNLEGPRGERKRVAAEQYWEALEREVDRLKICLRKDPNGRVKLSSNRFPVLFMELRDILCSLLPFSDRLVVEEVLEPEFLCQQLFRGVLDVVNLSSFIGKLMKEHCAPMRDALVDKMTAQFEIAQHTGKSDAFVLGLRMVFDLLEGMKLDVANHQLRTMKGDLQERAVANEREYFQERISKGRLDLSEVMDWIKPSFESDPTNCFSAFSKAFVNLLIPSSSSAPPSTFFFDFARLNNFKKDFRDLVSMQLCLLLYRELSVSLHPNATPPPNPSFNSLRLEIWSLLCDQNDSTKYKSSSSSLAIQIALRAAQHANPSATVPPPHLVRLAESWIDLNVASTTSKMFTLAESRVKNYLVGHIISSNGTSPQTALRGCECEGKIVWATGTETAMWLLAERMHRVASFHWAVFGDVYVDSTEY